MQDATGCEVGKTDSSDRISRTEAWPQFQNVSVRVGCTWNGNPIDIAACETSVMRSAVHPDRKARLGRPYAYQNLGYPNQNQNATLISLQVKLMAFGAIAIVLEMLNVLLLAFVPS